MAGSAYDALVVGARCAGAPLATFLARAGAKVLLVDRARLPSDQVLSTHTIHPPGMEVLDELGMGDAVRSLAPPMRRVRIAKGSSWADLAFTGERVDRCPRRKRLDALLQDAAAEAGVELRDRTRLEEVVFEAGRAVGGRLVSEGGDEVVRADVVVGADGRRSTVADQVGAGEYLAYDAPRGMYWSYWDPPPAWSTDAFPFGMYLGQRDHHVRVVFHTDHGQILVGSLPPVEEARSWSGSPLASLRESLAADPVTAALVERREPLEPVRGTLKERYYFRRAAGPGWALVGDAGHHKDFVVGDGITEALLEARSLAEAVAEGTDQARTRWWRARDLEALPRFEWGRQEGAAGRPAALESLVLERVARDPVLKQRMAGLPEHSHTPFDVLPMPVVLRCVAGGLARGKLGVLPELLGQVRSAVRYQRRRKRWAERLEEVSAAQG